MRQPNAPNTPVAGPSSNHFHRLPPIPTSTRHELPVPPPLRILHSDSRPPVPARPGYPPEITTRPSPAQGVSYQNVETNPFPVPPPPPPILPPRIGQAPRIAPGDAHTPTDVYGNYTNHGMHRPMSQMNLNAVGVHSNDSWNLESSLQAQLRAQKEEEERKAAEELRLEKERLRMEQEELHRKAMALEQQRQEERERQAAAMEKIRREQEELARLKAQAIEEEERRLERERWAEEERIRRAQWEEEERVKRELEREQWRLEEEERNRRLRMEMADERFATVFSMREEMEAERKKQEAEEKSKAAERAAEAEIARLKAEEEREKQERVLQEQRDAEMARKLEETVEEENEPLTNAVASHPTSTVQTPQQRVSNDLPNYDQLHGPQMAAPVPVAAVHPLFNPTVHKDQADVHPPHMGRPHANTTANTTQSPAHMLPHNQSFTSRPPLGMINSTISVNSNMSNGSSPARHSMMISPDHQPSLARHSMMPHPEHRQPSPGSMHPPIPQQHPGFSNAGTGQGPPYHNYFFPPKEIEAPPVVTPGPPARTGPAKLARQFHSVGGGNPGRLPAQNDNANARNGTLPMPSHPGHVAGSPSLPILSPPSNGRPSSANPAFSSVPNDINSSPGAGGSSQPIATSSNPGIVAHIVNEYPHGNASQQPIEPLSGIIHGFGRPALRDQDLPAATPVPDVITLEPEPSPPYFIVAHTWKHLVKFIASQNIAIIEPSPVALAREKHGPPNLRVVLHFAKIPRGDYRIVLYFALQSITPPPQDYPSYDTSVPPYLFPPPDPGRPIANAPEAQVYTIPTKPLPVLPMKVPNLAPYLTAALEESQRVHDSRARLIKLVTTVNNAVSAPPSVVQYMMSGITGGSGRTDQEMHGGPVKAVETSSGQKPSLISRLFRPSKASGSKGKGLNNQMYDVVTPFNAGDYH